MSIERDNAQNPKPKNPPAPDQVPDSPYRKGDPQPTENPDTPIVEMPPEDLPTPEIDDPSKTPAEPGRYVS
jgi:hypothetical protein